MRGKIYNKRESVDFKDARSPALSESMLTASGPKENEDRGEKCIKKVKGATLSSEQA